MSNHSSLAIQQIIEQCIKEHRGRLVAWLTCKFNDIDLAEDALQEATLAAFEHWPQQGVPQSPEAWLLKTAQNKAIDRLRRSQNFADKTQALAWISEDVNTGDYEQFDEPITDERLRLIFTCCHPALSEEARVALTLKVVAGLSTAAVARAFLLPETTLAQRLVRAKKKIKAAKIPYVTPPPEQWRGRVNAVLAVIYLIFNEGYYANSDTQLLQAELCDEAIRLAELLCQLLKQFPQNPPLHYRTEKHQVEPHCLKEHAAQPPIPLTSTVAETLGLLALMQFHDARREARTNNQGHYLTLEQQDRTRWNTNKIAHGEKHLQQAMTLNTRGTYQIQAAISALHCHAPQFEHTDWAQIYLLYGALYEVSPTPVVKLNQIVALSYHQSPCAALTELNQLVSTAALETYQPFHAVHADLLRRNHNIPAAQKAYDAAIKYAVNPVEKEFLIKKRAELGKLRIVE